MESTILFIIHNKIDIIKEYIHNKQKLTMYIYIPIELQDYKYRYKLNTIINDNFIEQIKNIICIDNIHIYINIYNLYKIRIVLKK